MLITRLKLLTLENQYWLHVRVYVLGRLKLICALEVNDAQLEHIENVAVKNAP